MSMICVIKYEIELQPMDNQIRKDNVWKAVLKTRDSVIVAWGFCLGKNILCLNS